MNIPITIIAPTYYRICWRNIHTNEHYTGRKGFNLKEARMWVEHLNALWDGLFLHWYEECKS